MTTLKFKDGVSFDTSGDFRIETRHDGRYVVGNGYLVPVKDQREAFTIIDTLKSKQAKKSAK